MLDKKGRLKKIVKIVCVRTLNLFVNKFLIFFKIIKNYQSIPIQEKQIKTAFLKTSRYSLLKIP